MIASPPLKKTTLGLTELSGAVFNLDLKSRQLLILADGKRTLDCIKQMRPNMDVHGIATRLMTDGYLHREPLTSHPLNQSLSQPLTQPRSPVQAPVEELTVSADSISQAKKIMIETTKTYIGMMGEDLIRKIDAASNLMQIKKCIAQWNMAMRDSSKGKLAANQHLQEVNLALES